MKLFKLSMNIISFVIVLIFLFCKSFVFSQNKSLINKKSYTAVVIEQGLVDCFPKGYKNSKGDSVSCEPSAVVFYNNYLIFASDKDIPNKSPVFSIPYLGNLHKDSISFYINKELTNTIKYEDFTITNDGKYIFATTGFDRVKSDHSWDNFNKLLYWKSGNENDVQVICSSEFNNVKSSVKLRKYFAKVLANDSFPSGMPYYKIEGLMCMPGNKLLFGVRETGSKYDAFQYRIAMIATEFYVENNSITIDTNFKLVYDYVLPKSINIYNPLALSSIEYDKFNKRIYLLTSFEKTNPDILLGGYLWVLTLDELKKRKPPVLVTKKDGSPLLFCHKPEGIAVIDKKTVFIVCDDDRITGDNKCYIPEMQFTRKLNQFAYYVVQFE